MKILKNDERKKSEEKEIQELMKKMTIFRFYVASK